MKLFLWWCWWVAVATASYSQMQPMEQVLLTHVNMFRTSPQSYCRTNGLFCPQNQTATLPLLFFETLYPSTRKCALQFTSSCSSLDVRDCPDCRRLQRIPMNVSNATLQTFKERMMNYSATFLDPLYNMISLSLFKKFVVLDLVYRPRVSYPIFIDGAHYSQGQYIEFWVHSFSAVQVSLVFYDHLVRFVDEFHMYPSDSSLPFPTFTVRLVNNRTFHEYYAFHANVNEKEVYSDLVPVNVPQ